MMRFLAIGTIIFTTMLTGCDGRSDEAELRQRLAEYERNWTSQHYEKVWRMMTDSLGDEDGSEERQFVKAIRDAEFAITGMEVLEIQIHGERAMVRRKSDFALPTGLPLGYEVTEDQWVKIDGIWYFEDYRSLESGDLLE